MALILTALILRPAKRLTSHYPLASTTPAGFTLVELLLTISILSIVMALSLPQLNGIYERQKLTSAANEVVTNLKSLQNKALANNQDRYTVAAPIGPLTDCTATYPLVNGYEFEVSSAGDSYVANFDFKDKNSSGSENCAAGTTKISTTLLPDGVHFQTEDRGKSVRYQTVSGEILLDNDDSATELKLELVSSRISSDVLAYCIHVNQGRVYVEQTQCGA